MGQRDLYICNIDDEIIKYLMENPYWYIIGTYLSHIPLPCSVQKELNDVKMAVGEGEMLDKRDHEKYRKTIGKINWLRYTRFDILFALSYCYGIYIE